jgi:hypothetical protein
MAVYSRRTLQRIIDENASFLKKGQIKKQVQRLNEMHKDMTLAWEWEVVLINALSKIGRVQYEKKFGCETRPDIFYESFDSGGINFVADVTAVSDKGLDESNPFEALMDDLIERVERYGLNGNNFFIDVGRQEGFVGGEPKIKLKLPGRARFDQEIFSNKFNEFIKNILINRHRKHIYSLKTDDADVVITYDPALRYASGHYACYSEILSKTENTVYSALTRKAYQLKVCGFEGPIGIFLCDGGSTLFEKKTRCGGSYSIAEVIKYFLSNHKEISFVVTHTIKRKQVRLSFNSGQYTYMNDYRVYGNVTKNSLFADLEKSIEGMVNNFPTPVCEPINAICRLKGPRHNMGISHAGGLMIAHGGESTKIKISARILTELLAGKLDQRDFLEMHGFFSSQLATSHIANPFDTVLQRGRLIHDINLEKSEAEDDDWVVFEFKGDDPAISPFKVPHKSTNKGDGSGKRHQAKN